MSFKAVLFDLDGTLLNTLPDLTYIVNATLSEAGYPERSMAEIQAFVGNGIESLLIRALPDGVRGDRRVIDRWLPVLRVNYLKYQNLRAEGYPGVPELLRELRKMGLRTAIVTNKMNRAANLVAEIFFPGLIDCVVGARDDLRLKPWPDQGEEALKTLGLQASDCIYVGDSETDVETGQNLCMLTLSATWGFRSREELIKAGATHLVDSPEKILDYIKYTE